jgi:hypothetical protein
MTRLYRWFKRLLGLYRNKRRHRPIRGLANYMAYFNGTPQLVIKQHRGIK